MNVRRRKRRHYSYKVREKIVIVQEAYGIPNNVNKTARKLGMVRDTDIRN